MIALRFDSPLAAASQDPFDAHFRFGLIKAEMILTCINLIKELLESGGRSPIADVRIQTVDVRFGLLCVCHKRSGFRIARVTVNKPYLEIQYGDVRVGLGLQKAESVLVVEDELTKFVKQHIEMPF